MCTQNVYMYSKVRINVHSVSRGADVPVVTCADVSGRLGEPVTLTCDVRANPSASVQWLHGPVLDSAQLVGNDTHVSDKVTRRFVCGAFSKAAVPNLFG